MADLLQQKRFTFKEAADLVRINLATIWRWTLHGARGRKLRSVHIGGRRFILFADLESFLAPPDEPNATGSPPTARSSKRAEAAVRELASMGM